MRRAAGLVGTAWRGKPRAVLPRPEALRDHQPRVLQGFHIIKESARFSFYSRNPKEKVNLEKAERCLDRFEELLAQRVHARIHYYYHEDPGMVAWATGLYAAGVANLDYGIIHSVRKLHEHEVVHIVTSYLGKPPDFFNEGIATALDSGGKWGGVGVHKVAERWLDRNPHLRTVDLLVDRFEAINKDARYPIAGSFMKRMIDEYGIRRVADFFRRSKTSHWKTAFQDAFGVPIKDAEALWLRKL